MSSDLSVRETIATVDAPIRLDAWVARTEVTSRAAAQERIDAGLVLVDGRPAKSAARLRGGELVTFLRGPDAPAATAGAGPAVELDVVYEDEWLAVIDKPAGLVVHPAPGHASGTVADALRQRGDTWSRAGGAERAGIVHRLDRFTSGLMVVAKTDAAHRALAAQLANRSLGRTYWALVHGVLREDTGTIEAPIARDPRNRQRMGVVDEGRASRTDFRVLERLPRATVLELDLRTGRTHQIRVHCAWIGRPLVGDGTYGGDRRQSRPALHARRLRLTHPGDGTPRAFESPVPAELLDVLEQARRGEL